MKYTPICVKDHHERSLNCYVPHYIKSAGGCSAVDPECLEIMERNLV